MASPPKPAWAVAQEAKAAKEEQGKQLAFKQAFEATFADVEPMASGNSSSEEDEEDTKARTAIGPVDASKCTAAGTGVGGGVLSVAATVVVTAKDSEGRRIPNGGANVRVRVAPGVGVVGQVIEAAVVDQNDGTYVASYTVYNRGNYMVSVELNGKHIAGSPIPVFFGAQAVASPPPFNQAPPQNASTGVLPGQAGLLASGALQIQVPSGVTGLGNLPGILPGPTGGAVLPGVGAQVGEVCRNYLDGRCKNNPCRYAHPTLQQLMTAFASGANMGSLTSMPMAPSAAAMAAAQSIAAAQALQRVIQVAMAATANQEESEEDDDANPFLDEPRALQVRNLSPLVLPEQVKQLFGFCGTVVECTIDGADSAREAYVEFEKPEEASAALQLNGMTVGDRPVQVEHTKLRVKKREKDGGVAASLKLMQQAIQLQQMQYQQALAQQTLAAQQMVAARNPAKLAADMAKQRALELSKQLKALGGGGEGSDEERCKSPSSLKSYSPPPRMRSPSPRRRRSPPRRYPSRSPPRYGRDGRRDSRDRYESRRYRDRGRRDVDYDRDRDRRRYRSPERTRRGSSRKRYSRSPSRERRSSRYRSKERPRSRDRSRRDRSPSRRRSASRGRRRDERRRSTSRDERRPSISRDAKRARAGSLSPPRPSGLKERRSRSAEESRPLPKRSPSADIGRSAERQREGSRVKQRLEKEASRSERGDALGKEERPRSMTKQDAEKPRQEGITGKAELKIEGQKHEEAKARDSVEAREKEEDIGVDRTREKSPGTVERELRAAVERSMRERMEASRAEAKGKGQLGFEGKRGREGDLSTLSGEQQKEAGVEKVRETMRRLQEGAQENGFEDRDNEGEAEERIDGEKQIKAVAVKERDSPAALSGDGTLPVSASLLDAPSDLLEKQKDAQREPGLEASHESQGFVELGSPRKPVLSPERSREEGVASKRLPFEGGKNGVAQRLSRSPEIIMAPSDRGFGDVVAVVAAVNVQTDGSALGEAKKAEQPGGFQKLSLNLEPSSYSRDKANTLEIPLAEKSSSRALNVPPFQQAPDSKTDEAAGSKEEAKVGTAQTLEASAQDGPKADTLGQEESRAVKEESAAVAEERSAVDEVLASVEEESAAVDRRGAAVAEGGAAVAEGGAAVAEGSAAVKPQPMRRAAEFRPRPPAMVKKAPSKAKAKAMNDDDDLMLPSIRKKPEEDEEEGFGLLGGKLPFAAPKLKPAGRKGGGISFKLGSVSRKGDEKTPESPATKESEQAEPGVGLTAAEVQQGLVKSKEGAAVSNGALADLKKALVDDDEERLPLSIRKAMEKKHQSRRHKHRGESSERDASSEEGERSRRLSARKSPETLRRSPEGRGYRARDEYYSRHRSRSSSRRASYREERRHSDRYDRDRYRRERYYEDDGGRYEAPDSEEERRELARRGGKRKGSEEGGSEEGEFRRAHQEDTRYPSDENVSVGERASEERREKKKRRKERKKRHKRSKSGAEIDDIDKDLVPYSEDEHDEESRQEKRKRRKEGKKRAGEPLSGDSSSDDAGKRKRMRMDEDGPDRNGRKGSLGVSDEAEVSRKRKRRERKKRKHKHRRQKSERREESGNDSERSEKRKSNSDASDVSPARSVN